MTDQPHARALDIPGWPCPPRVRDIPTHSNSWGWIPCDAGHLAADPNSPGMPRIAQDDLGYLWADGNAIPGFHQMDNTNHAPGAILFWANQGLGVHIHPKSLPYLGNISRLDMEPDRWIPIAEVAAELPEFVTDNGLGASR